jgi:hypothetical protein
VEAETMFRLVILMQSQWQKKQHISGVNCWHVSLECGRMWVQVKVG